MSIVRSKIYDLEDALRELPPAETPLNHYYAHGTYTREMFLAAGTIITGKIHRHSCINIISQGKVAVVTDDGKEEFEAPYIFVSGPNTKKAVVVLEDTIWINVHPWDGKKDPAEMEEELIIPCERRIE